MAGTRISRSEVAKVAQLARLETSETELDELAGELDTVLDYFASLAKVDTDGVPPMAESVSLRAPLRADVVQAGLRPEDVVANSPSEENGAFSVPRVLTRDREKAAR